MDKFENKCKVCTEWRGEDGNPHHDPDCVYSRLAMAESEIVMLYEKLDEANKKIDLLDFELYWERTGQY